MLQLCNGNQMDDACMEYHDRSKRSKRAAKQKPWQLVSPRNAGLRSYRILYLANDREKTD